MILYEIATRHPMEESFSKGLSAWDISRRKKCPVADSMNSNWRVSIKCCWSMTLHDPLIFREITDDCGVQYCWTTDRRQDLSGD
jgi:hypothetical protein